MFYPCQKCEYKKYKCLGCIFKDYLDLELSPDDIATLRDELDGVRDENEALRAELESGNSDKGHSLPCCVGDSFYLISSQHEQHIINIVIDAIYLISTNTTILWFSWVYQREQKWQMNLEDFCLGVNVFKTYREAEALLPRGVFK